MRKTFIAALALLLGTAAVADDGVYLRFAAGSDRTRATTVRDRDCASTQPPALFGCVSGLGDAPLAARGDFGTTPLFEIGAGFRVARRARVELALARRTKVDLDANANFPNVAPEQPVDARGRSLSLMLRGALDLAPASWRVRPFVDAAAGAARNTTGAVTYSFPSIAANAVTITEGGKRTSFAWSAGGGASIDLTSSLAFEIALRYSNLGEMRTADGPATIIRPTRTLTIDIAGTRAPLRSRGVTLALLYRPAGR